MSGRVHHGTRRQHGFERQRGFLALIRFGPSATPMVRVVVVVVVVAGARVLSVAGATA